MHSIRLRASDTLTTARGVAPAHRRSAATQRARETSTQLARAVRRHLLFGHTRMAEATLGPETANRSFWRTPKIDPNWADVRDRLRQLHDVDPSTIEGFVARAVVSSRNPSVIAGLARHPHTKEAFRRWLTSQRPNLSAELVEHLIPNEEIGGALAGVARLLLAPDEAQDLRDRIVDLYDAPSGLVFQIDDSISYRIGESTEVDHSPAHRLIIADTLAHRDEIALLLPGAKSTTVLATLDTFGKEAFDDLEPWATDSDLTVEHIRTRISRFSQEYIDIHESVAQVAKRLAATVAKIDGLLHDDDLPYLEVRIADFVFFQALQIRSIETLLADATFDHIVVAIGNHLPSSDFIRLLRGVDGLAEDPRVEFVSTATSRRSRALLRASVYTIAGLRRIAPANEPSVPGSVLGAKLAGATLQIAEPLGSFDSNVVRPSVMLATASNPAYIDSAAAYAAELGRAFDIRILHVGANATDLAAALDSTTGGVPPIDFLASTGQVMDQLATHIANRLAYEFSDDDDGASTAPRVAKHATEATIHRLAKTAIVPALASFMAARHWFERMKRERRLPSAVVLTPQRNPAVSQIAAVAREHGVPSIAVEPHAQDANYSRYTKVHTDYYGVLSDYFRTRASAGFCIDIDRVEVIGSPRQVAPPGYDPDVAQRVARRTFQATTGVELGSTGPAVIFFGQPSKWEHVEKVWSNILTASRAVGAQVLLKPHPEESPSRLQQYLACADASVTVLDCDAATAIALADIVLTAYSSAAIDAAIRRRPVIGVTDGPGDYPLDVAAMVGAPMARSASELADLLEAFAQDPDPFTAQAIRFLDQEPQMIRGPGPGLRRLVAAAVESGESGLRSKGAIPKSLFLDGPHPTFST